MILIKDRHPGIQLCMYCNHSYGKYDTYKGSTQVSRIYDFLRNYGRVMELPRLNIPVDIHIDVGNTNISTEDKIKLAENIQSAVRDVFLSNLNYSENEDLYTSRINFK